MLRIHVFAVALAFCAVLSGCGLADTLAPTPLAHATGPNTGALSGLATQPQPRHRLHQSAESTFPRREPNQAAHAAIVPWGATESVVNPLSNQVSLSVTHAAAQAPAFHLHVLETPARRVHGAGIPLGYRQSIDLGALRATDTRLVAFANGKTVFDTGLLDLGALAGSALTVIAVDHTAGLEQSGAQVELLMRSRRAVNEPPHTISRDQRTAPGAAPYALPSVTRDDIQRVAHDARHQPVTK